MLIGMARANDDGPGGGSLLLPMICGPLSARRTPVWTTLAMPGASLRVHPVRYLLRKFRQVSGQVRFARAYDAVAGANPWPLDARIRNHGF